MQLIELLRQVPEDRITRIATEAGLSVLARGLSAEEAIAEAIRFSSEGK